MVPYPSCPFLLLFSPPRILRLTHIMVAISTARDARRFVDDLDDVSRATTPVMTPCGSVAEWDTLDEKVDLCPDCNLAHIPRRIVCCVDGTWMEPDGMAGFLADSFHGNASNIFRIWCSVKEGVVEDESGKKWQQIRKYYKGLGAELDSVPRLIAGVLGDGFEKLIYKVYRFCALSCCPSTDEIYLFGFSRGAFVVRAVAGLFHHLRTLNPAAPDFDELYSNALKVYRHIRDKNEFRQHEIYHHIVANTSKSPKIRFIGAIDTVKAVNDAKLYDISLTDNTEHVRHALALLESRHFFASNTYNLGSMDLTRGRSCMEAWFLGGHGNLGGSREADGLSLWPLQWLLSEAQTCGLVTGFVHLDNIQVQDPVEYAMPGVTQEERILLKNGRQVRMWDLTDVFSESRFLPVVSVARSKLGELAEGEREILAKDSGSGFVHPSVFYHDDMTPLGLAWINSLKSRSEIRRNRRKIDLKWHELFWNRDFKQRVDITLRHPRVLVCGAFGVGKSALINMALDDVVAVENEEYTPTNHDIGLELSSEHSRFIFHDSCGFEPGQQDHYTKVQNFLDERRKQSTFTKQLHCIWYCIGANDKRISTCDAEFFKNVDFKKLTVILVFTQSDELRAICPRKAKTLYESRHGIRLPVRQSQIPPDVHDTLSEMEDEIFESEKSKKVQKVKALLGEKAQNLMSVFISKYDEDGVSLAQLLSKTERLLESTVLIQIHNEAVRNRLNNFLPKAVEVLVGIGLKSRKRLLNPFNSEASAVIFREFLQTAQVALREVFKLKMKHDVQFANFDQLFSSLYVEKAQGSFVARSISASVGASLGLALPMAPFALVLGALAVPVITIEIFTRSKEILVQCALLILTYERMFWFGVASVSEEMVSRASIEVLKISPDVEALVHDKLTYFGSDDWRAILSDTVKQFRYKQA
ncbi:hypothetical protein CONLIGDRAFT_440593 [Coniochaeta ligniaria NRRL 30616]|uniref:T6SS Phospholipase effector Tle1-like catalytic domain-containing protein n=1 Tax=Coniochaeta ligniaria NRRL 30616 TaxID=1408157 RepID=A0A1J7IJN0_9PEZI|nr:hypothetical protein CONLIGDRAFT_440593 [Coniochaeta ligniaria NRRL 30616]